MTVHLIKLCVGADSIADLADWQTKHRRAKTAAGETCVVHTTFQAPKRQFELLDGGSLYWVIKGAVTVRQRLVGFADGHKQDGSRCCLLQLDPELVPVSPVPRRPFQGWRYFNPDDAPLDLSSDASRDIAAMPAKMRKELAALGLL